MRAALKVKDVSDKFQGTAYLWRLTKTFQDYKYVITSAAYTFDRGNETFIFPANKKGEVKDWGELDGSLYSELDHVKAIKSMGYRAFEEIDQ